MINTANDNATPDNQAVDYVLNSYWIARFDQRLIAFLEIFGGKQ